MTRSSECRQEGSALIETLVAFVILAAVMVLALRGFSQSLRQVARVEEMTILASEAQSLMAQAVADPNLRAGETGGRTARGHRWTLSVGPRPGAPSPSWTDMRAYDLVLEVSGDGPTAGHVRLDSIGVAGQRR